MVIVPDRFIFLETPRTASRSVAVTIEESVRFAKRSNCRHVKPEDVPRETGLPIWTFTREPVSHLYSWYKYGLENNDFSVFNEDRSKILTFPQFVAKEFCPLQGFEPNCLNIYYGVANHFWPLEWGLSAFFLKLGIKPKNKHFIGEIKGLQSTPFVDRDLFQAKFKRDTELYSVAVGGKP